MLLSSLWHSEITWLWPSEPILFPKLRNATDLIPGWSIDHSCQSTQCAVPWESNTFKISQVSSIVTCHADKKQLKNWSMLKLKTSSSWPKPLLATLIDSWKDLSSDPTTCNIYKNLNSFGWMCNIFLTSISSSGSLAMVKRNLAIGHGDAHSDCGTITPKYPLSLNLVGGWPTPLKNMSSSVGMIIPNIWKVPKIHVPNHQPGMFIPQKYGFHGGNLTHFPFGDDWTIEPESEAMWKTQL